MILEELGYNAYLNFRISSGQSEENIHQKLSVLKVLGGRVPDFPDFFEKLEGLEEKLKEPQKKDQRPPWVTLTTFHSSKGLEFEKVFIIDATEGQIPGAAGTDDQKAYAEEVRLFYVAATRAKKELIFLCQKDSNKAIQPSSFISYLLDGLPQPKKNRIKTGVKTAPRESFGTGRVKWQDYRSCEAEFREMDLSAYQEGTTISHQRFGAGRILERNGELAIIYFETTGEKKMNLAVCLENGVIS
jgi:DNA helicase-2/ATP-dependent DNA helicase PcrA